MPWASKTVLEASREFFALAEAPPANIRALKDQSRWPHPASWRPAPITSGSGTTGQPPFRDNFVDTIAMRRMGALQDIAMP